MKSRIYLKFAFVVVLSFTMLLGCSQVEDPAVAVVEEPAAPPTNTPLPPTPTEVPPTETQVPPTETAVPPTETLTPTPLPPTETPTPEPTKNLPEVPVTQMEDLVGQWGVGKYNNYIETFDADGTAILKDNKGQIVDLALCHFDGDLLTCISDNCTKADANTGTVTKYTCTCTYRVFLTKDGDTPIHLRYEVVEDPVEFRMGMLTLKLWFWMDE